MVRPVAGVVYAPSDRKNDISQIVLKWRASEARGPEKTGKIGHVAACNAAPLTCVYWVWTAVASRFHSSPEQRRPGGLPDTNCARPRVVL